MVWVTPPGAIISSKETQNPQSTFFVDFGGVAPRAWRNSSGPFSSKYGITPVVGLFGFGFGSL